MSLLLCIPMLHAHMPSRCNAAMLQCKNCTTGIRAPQAQALLIELKPKGVVFSFLFVSHRQKLSAGGTAGGDGAEVWPYASAGQRGICPSATLDPDRHLEVRLTQTGKLTCDPVAKSRNSRCQCLMVSEQATGKSLSRLLSSCVRLYSC